MPTVSVIVPVYQVEKYIEKTILSICNQTFRDIEVILIDDGSRDNSIDICAKVLSLYPEVCYKIFHQENKGVAAARNKGINLAAGEWVICVDSDDTIHPRMVELLFQATKVMNVDIAFCDFKYVSMDKRTDFVDESFTSIKVIEQKQLADSFLKREIKIIAPSLFIKKSFMISNHLQYPADCKYSEDLIFIWSLITVLDKAAYISYPLYNYLIRPGSIMTSSTPTEVLTGYLNFINIEKILFREDIDIGIDCNLILPRWVLGALHSSAKVLDYNVYVALANQMDYKKQMKKLMRFPAKTVVVLSFLAMTSLRLFYMIIRKF